MKSYDHLLGYNFIEIARKINIQITKDLSQYDITFPQYRILSRLFIMDHLSPSQLSSLLSISLPTLSPILTLLEQKGWITRRPDPADGRSKIISITPEGLAKRNQAFEVVMGYEQEKLRILDEPELGLLLKWLQEMNQHLD